MKMLFGLIFFSSVTMASPSLTSRMTRLSFQLRGSLLSFDEKKELALVSPQDEAKFIEQKTNEYLNSNRLSDAFLYWQLERFKLKTFILSDEAEKETQLDLKDSFANLVTDILNQNLSWDQFLLSKNYRLVPLALKPKSREDVRARVSDFDFFSLLVPSLPREGVQLAKRPSDPSELQALNLSFPDSESRVAGVLTTPRFLRKYTTTDVNKNRRRAAQVYRIFLCDTMFPAIPEDANRKSKYLSQVFAIHETATEEQLKASLEIGHGAQESCRGCHSKLDPLGVLFQSHTTVLNPVSSTGSLKIPRATETFQTPVLSVADLAKTLVAQPEYEACQIRWFWNQFIGKDIDLKDEKLELLKREFNRVQRRTKDFIKVIASQPEFFNPPAPIEASSFAAVKPLLKRCDSCHESESYMFSEDVPHFATLFEDSKSDESTISWLLKMRTRLNLPSSDTHKMPQNFTHWTEADLTAVKSWINSGAKDDAGTQWLEPQ